MPKVLVVDDNEQLSSMLKDVLESWRIRYSLVPSSNFFSPVAKKPCLS